MGVSDLLPSSPHATTLTRMEQSPGWYPAPDQPGMERWWAGSMWTDDVRPAPAPTAPSAPQAPAVAMTTSQPSRKGREPTAKPSWFRRMVTPRGTMTRGRKIGGCFGLIVGVLAFLAMTVGFPVAGVQAWQRGPQETARAVAIVTSTGHCGKHSTASTATFTVDGQSYTADASCSADIGDHVTIKYDPTNPAHNGDNRGMAIMYFVLALVGLGLFAMTAGSLVALIRTPLGPPRRRRRLP